MRIRYLFFPVAVMMTAIFSGCIAPLAPDPFYPREWGEITRLGDQCKLIEGSYVNDGEWRGEDNQTKNVSLSSILFIPSNSKKISLFTNTRRTDSHGDSFINLKVVPDNNQTSDYNIECFCIDQNIICPGLNQSYGFAPVGFASGGNNVYFSIGKDNALLGRVDDVRLGLIFVVPIHITKKAWVRFKHADQ